MKNRKRLLHSLRGLSYAFLCSLLLFTTACESDDAKKGIGYVSFRMSADSEYVNTRAGDGTNLDEYRIQILQEGTVKKEFLYSEQPDELALEEGAYEARAFWGDEVDADFETLYMEGTTTFSIKEGMSTTVAIEATPANAKVVVKYNSELGQVYNDYYINMETSFTNTPLKYSKTETRPAFFRANSNGEKLDLDMVFKTAKNEYQFDKSYTIYPRDFVTFNVRLAEDENGGGSTQSPTIQVNPSSLTIPAKVSGSYEATVTSNTTDWTSSSNVSWIRVAKSTNKVTLTIEDNSTTQSRSGTITLNASLNGKTATSYLRITQQAQTSTGDNDPYIVPVLEEIKAESFEDVSIKISTNAGSNWSSSQDEESKTWLQVTTQTSQNTLILNTLSANNSSEDREAILTLTATLNGKTATGRVRIIQSVSYPELYMYALVNAEVVDYRIKIEQDTRETEVEISTNASEWEALIPENDQEWIQVVKGENDLTLKTSVNTDVSSRSTILSLKAYSGNKDLLVPILITQSGYNPDDPKLLITITVNDEIKEEVILEGYELEDPSKGVMTPQFFTYGFTGGNLISMSQGSARSKIVNVRAIKGIKTCVLKNNSGDQIDLLNSNNPVCSLNESKTLGVIYLDEWLNSLAANYYSYTLQVTDQNDAQNELNIMILVQN